MHKVIVMCLFLLVCSGCASYSFTRKGTEDAAGYLVSRDGYVIPEYTISSESALPTDLAVAQERFRKRRKMVEHYYKKMGYIENRFKQIFVNPAVVFGKFLFGQLRLPFVAFADYKYDHNPEYRERVQSLERAQEQKEQLRIQKWQAKLNQYIGTAKAPDAEVEVKAVATTQTREEQIDERLKVLSLEQEKFVSRQARAVRKKQETTSTEVAGVEATIIARPSKGYSPLRIRFIGTKSRSKNGRIISYQWDFGDGDTSREPNPENTYYSVSADPRVFAVVLTVTDAAGKSATARTNIEVFTK